MKQKELVLGAIVLVSLVIAVLTYDPHTQTSNPVLNLLVTLHAPLMFVMVLLAAAFGYSINKSLRGEISHQTQKNHQRQQELVHLLLQTLSSNEREALKEILKKPTTQAALSAKIGRLRAFRAVKNLSAKNLIAVREDKKTKHLTANKKLL